MRLQHRIWYYNRTLYYNINFYHNLTSTHSGDIKPMKFMFNKRFLRVSPPHSGGFDIHAFIIT